MEHTAKQPDHDIAYTYTILQNHIESVPVDVDRQEVYTAYRAGVLQITSSSMKSNTYRLGPAWDVIEFHFVRDMEQLRHAN